MTASAAGSAAGMRFSLAQKFFALICALLVTAIVVFLVLAIRLFHDDKMPYVYAENVALAETLAAETGARLESALKTVRAVGLLLERDFKTSAARERAVGALIGVDEDIVALAIYSVRTLEKRARVDTGARLFSFVKPVEARPDLPSEGDLGSSAKARPLTLAALERDRVHVSTARSPSGVPLLRIALGIPGGDGDGLERALVATLLMGRFVEIFGRSTLYETLLVDRQGRILVHQDPTRIGEATLLARSEALQGVLKKKIKASAEEFRGQGESIAITAYARVQYGNLAVVSQIDTDKAFLGSRRLVEKSILFAVLILLISVLASHVFTQRLTASIRRLYMATRRLAAGDLDTAVEVASRDEIGALGTSFNFMTGEIKQLLRATAEKSRMERELETAQLVQTNFLPARYSRVGPLATWAYPVPASECGGDWWGRFPAGPGRELLLIGDAVGHGVPAALVTAMMFSMCRFWTGEARLFGAAASPSPATLLARFNEVLWDGGRGARSMTMFAALFDFAAGAVTFANAGHVFPLLIPAAPMDARLSPKPDGAPRRYAPLKSRGMPLGLGKEGVYTETRLDLLAGDRFVFYTDGLIECRSPRDAVWGKVGLFRAIDAHADEAAQQLGGRLCESAFAFFAGRRLDDDVTVVVAEIADDWRAGMAHVAPAS